MIIIFYFEIWEKLNNEVIERFFYMNFVKYVVVFIGYIENVFYRWW